MCSEPTFLTPGVLYSSLFSAFIGVLESSLHLCGKGVGVSREDWNICGLTTKELECPSLNWLMLPTILEPFLPSFPSSLSQIFLLFVCFFFFFSSLCVFAPLGIAVWSSLWKCSLYPELWNHVYSNLDIIVLTTDILAFVFESQRGAHGHKENLSWAEVEIITSHSAHYQILLNADTHSYIAYSHGHLVQNHMSQHVLTCTFSEHGQ